MPKTTNDVLKTNAARKFPFDTVLYARMENIENDETMDSQIYDDLSLLDDGDVVAVYELKTIKKLSVKTTRKLV